MLSYLEVAAVAVCILAENSLPVQSVLLPVQAHSQSIQHPHSDKN